MPSALWPVRAKLFTVLEAAHAGTSTVVFDGPRRRGESPKRYLIVGSSGDLLDDVVGRAEQVPHPAGNNWRQEAGEVDCVAVAWSGDSDLARLRTAVEGIVDLSEIAINANPQLDGLLQPNENVTEISRIDVREQRTDKGPFVEAVFSVAYSTLITPA